MARLQAQSAENAALKERQAKASSDLQVTHRLHTSAPDIPTPWVVFAFCSLLFHIIDGQLPSEIRKATLIPNFPCIEQLSGAQSVPGPWILFPLSCLGSEVACPNCFLMQSFHSCISVKSSTSTGSCCHFEWPVTMCVSGFCTCLPGMCCAFTGFGGETAAGEGTAQQAAVCL